MDSAFTIGSAVTAVERQMIAAHSQSDTAAMAGFYTPDAILTAENTDFLSGWAAIQGFWQRIINLGIRALERETIEMDILGDTVVEMGTYAIMDATGRVMDRGKFLTVWKERDGQWMLHRDFYNSFPIPE